MTIPIDVGGPHLLEIFVVTLSDRVIKLSGPCGPAAWIIETFPESHPMDVANETINRVLGTPRLVHSTSWRWQGASVVLTFLAVVDGAAVAEYESKPFIGAELARGGARSAPSAIGSDQVLEHALRHLAWLVKDDVGVAAALTPGWHESLERYVPAPFQHL